MKNRLRVMHLITKLELGGAQQNTLYCVAHHDCKKFDVLLACGQGGMLDSEASKIPNAKVFFLPYLKHHVSPFNDLMALFKLKALFKREQVDILHTHSSKAGILGRLAGAMAGVPVIVHTFHGFGFHDRQPWLVRKIYIWLERLAARKSSVLIGVSTENIQKARENHIGSESQYRVIHSSIQLQDFVKAKGGKVRRELGIGPQTPLVGMVSNLKPQKAPLDFIRAAAIVSQHLPLARFFIAGDGELRPQAEALIQELGLKNKLFLLGWRRDIPELMAALDVLALSSLWEGLPRVFPQAMAAGKPIVATAVDGALEAIHEGRNGYLVEPGDFRALAEKIIYVLEHPAVARKVGQAGKKIALKEFDIRRMVKDIEKIYIGKAVPI